MKDKEFIQNILDKIGEFGDGELEFETRDIERLCNIALKAVKNNAVLPHFVVSLKCDCKHSGSCRYEEVVLETKELCRHKE